MSGTDISSRDEYTFKKLQGSHNYKQWTRDMSFGDMVSFSEGLKGVDPSGSLEASDVTIHFTKFGLQMEQLGKLHEIRHGDCKNIQEFMTKIRDIKTEIEDLGITMDEAITIQVLNSLASSFVQFLGILSHEAREKEKLPTLESLAKSLEEEELQMKNHNKATANYAKRFTKRKSKSSTTRAEDSEDSATSSSSKSKFYEKEHRTNECWHLQAECRYCHDIGHIAKFCKKKPSSQTSPKEVVTCTQHIPAFVSRSSHTAHGYGDVIILGLVHPDGSKVTWTIKKVSWTPSLGHNLFSTIPLVRKGVEVFLRQPHVPSETSHRGSLFGVADIIDNQYIVRTTGYFPNSAFDQEITNAITPMSIKTWDRRMGHLGYQDILRLPKVADGIDVKGPIPEEISVDCMNRRQQRKPSYEPMTQPKEYLEYLHCDLGGSYTPARRGNRFYLGIRDGATGTCYAEPMRTKGQTFDTFQKFIRRAEHQERSSSIYVPTLGENLQIKPLEVYTAKEGVKWEPSAPYTPEQNGKAFQIVFQLSGMSRLQATSRNQSCMTRVEIRDSWSNKMYIER